MIPRLGRADFMFGQYIYHRIAEAEELLGRKETGEIDLPITEEGAPMPHIFGRCRVETPILAWNGPVTFDERAANVWDMHANQFFVLGRGFEHVSVVSLASNRVHGMYAGDRKLSDGINGNTWSTRNGAGGHEQQVQSTALITSDYSVVGDAEFLAGFPNLQLVDGSGTSLTFAADAMIDTGTSHTVIPGYRGMMSVLLFQDPEGFNHGRVNGLPSYQFEASSYQTHHPQLGTYARVGDDSNPINVIHAILTSPHLMGLPESMLDMASFQTAQFTLHTESHGYSRFWNKRTEAREMLSDVLRQIDGLIYFEQRTGKSVVRLVRNDYDPLTIPEINRSNCVKLTNFSIGGRTNLINKVRVTYLARDSDYQQRSASAQNMANAVGQDGQVSEEVIDYPGCCRANQAAALAARELAHRSTPVVKCRALVQRSLLRVVPGDVVKLVWTNPDVAGAVFRVVGVDRGTLEDGVIGLDLLLDNGYVHRNQTPQPPDFGDVAVDGLDFGFRP